MFPVSLDTPYEELYEVAKRDQDQYTVIRIINWRGDIITKSTIEFLVLLDDDTKIWKDFMDPDFKNNSVLLEYINDNPALLSLKFSIKDWKEQQKVYSSEQVVPFDKCYIDFRAFNLGWRKKIMLPDLTDDPKTESKKYVLEAEWSGFQDSSKRHALVPYVHLDDQFTSSNAWIKQFASETVFCKSTMVLLDDGMTRKYPLLKST